MDNDAQKVLKDTLKILSDYIATTDTVNRRLVRMIYGVSICFTVIIVYLITYLK